MPLNSRLLALESVPLRAIEKFSLVLRIQTCRDAAAGDAAKIRATQTARPRHARASAGGLNKIFLGNALIRQGSFNVMSCRQCGQEIF